MAMDLTGASLTTSEIRSITSNIDQIGKDIANTMESVNDTMKTLIGQDEGGFINNTATAVQQLNNLTDVLVASLLNIGLKIGKYMDIMLTHDTEAADALRKSIESKAYGTR